MVSLEAARSAAGLMRETFGLSLFGFDLIVDETTAETLVIDVNYFPSFRSWEDFPQVCKSALKALLVEACSCRPLAYHVPREERSTRCFVLRKTGGHRLTYIFCQGACVVLNVVPQPSPAWSAGRTSSQQACEDTWEIKRSLNCFATIAAILDTSFERSPRWVCTHHQAIRVQRTAVR